MKTFTDLGHCIPGGHPRKIEPSIREAIHEHVQQRQDSMNTITDKDIARSLHKGIVASTLRKRKLSALTLVETSAAVISLTNADTDMVSTRYLNKYCADEKMTVARSDKTTEARDNACKCPFLSYVWYVVCEALSAHLPASHKWNADGSTYEFTCSEKNIKSVFFRENSDDDFLRSQRKPRQKLTDNSLSISIKIQYMASAAGDSSDMVAIIAMDELE